MATIWQKAFSRIFWKNRPNTGTPLGESKLLPMDASIDEIDDRVVTLQQTKAEQSDFLTSIKNIQFNRQTGVFTITKFNDTTFTIDTDLEKIAVNFDYDDDPTSAHYQQIILTLIDGTVKYIDLSALITQYEFIDTATIHFSVGADGKISATVIDGSITESKLQPNYLGDIRVETAKSQQYMTNAQTAQNAAETAQGLAEDAQEAAETAQGLAETAQTGAEDARDRASASATSASTSETNALASATQAGTYASNASTSASNASTSESNASTYAANASNSASSASQSATSASDNAQDSEAWAVGQKNGQDVPSTDPRYHNNSKYYAEQAEASLSNTVRSFNGRNGAVAPTDGDYNIEQISPLNGATVGQVPVIQNVGTAQEPVYKFGMQFVSGGGIFYGTCTGEEANQIKAVTVSNEQNFKLKAGSILAVKFDANNTYSATTENPVKLNVNNTGAKQIYGGNTATPTGTNTTYFGRLNYYNYYVYDGTYWVWAGSSADNNTTYTPQTLGFGYATCSTAAATTAKVATLSGYSLVTNGIVSVKFTNSVPANATLNINNRGAKNIYYQGAKIVAGVIKAGDIATFVYSGNYNLICIDRGSNGHIIQNSSGTDMTQRAKMQFPDSHVSDDSTNGRTVIENVKEVTLSELSQATERGMYLATDEESVPIGEIEEDYVEVVADGEKTIATLMGELYALSDMSKLSGKSFLVEKHTSGNNYVYNIEYFTSINAIFTNTIISSNTRHIMTLTMASTGSRIDDYAGNITDYSSSKLSNGTKITLHYGTSSGTVELNTDARTWKYVARVTDHNAISIPTGVREIFCLGEFGNMSVIFPTSVGNARSGYYSSANDNGDIYVAYSNNQLVVIKYLINGLDVISQGVKVYYR